MFSTYIVLTLFSVIGCLCDVPFMRNSNPKVTDFTDLCSKVVEKKYKGNMVTSPLGVAAMFLLETYVPGIRTTPEFQAAARRDEVLGWAGLVEGARKYNGVEISYESRAFFTLEFWMRRFGRRHVSKHLSGSSVLVDYLNSKMEEGIRALSGTITRIRDYEEENVVSPNDFNTNSSVFFVNMVSVKALWKQQFDENSTTLRPFYLSENNSVNVPTMHMKSYLKLIYNHTIKARILELPYQGEDFDMIIVSPHGNATLDDVERNMVFSEILQDLQGNRSSPVSLYMPKFKIESSLSLEDTWEQIGMTDKADVLLNQPVHVPLMRQKAVLEVDEKGFENSTITSFINSEGLELFETVDLNNPFFVIVQWKNVPVLVARITDPRKE